MTTTNLVLRIVLPKGLGLTNGQTMQDDTTLEVVGAVSPWYCSVEQVKLDGGSYLAGLSPITAAAMIKQVGEDVDGMSYRKAIPPQPGSTEDSADFITYKRFLHGRSRYVASQAALTLIQNTWDITSGRGAKTLGNFSVSRNSLATESVADRLKELKLNAAGWLIVVKSGGQLGFNSAMPSVMAMKGKFDIDPPPGREWLTTGMGANRTTVAGFGSEGKPVKFGAPAIVSWRTGRYSGGYMSVVPKYLVGAY